MILPRPHRVLICGHSPRQDAAARSPCRCFSGLMLLFFVSGPQVSCLLTQMTHSHAPYWKACLLTVMVSFMSVWLAMVLGIWETLVQMSLRRYVLEEMNIEFNRL